MYHKFQLQSTRSALLSASILPLLFTLVLFVMSSATFAQGTSTGPFTNHIVDPGPSVTIGTPVNPIPIDLDPLGPPWSKSIGDPNNLIVGIKPLDIFESILNIGTESWGDWHEILLSPPAGLTPSTWDSVVGLSVNGNPIGFSATGLGTQILDLFNFSQPVLPGDVFGIHKIVLVDGANDANGGALIRMREYPTSSPIVPEPASLALVGMIGLAVAGRRRRR